MRYANFRSLLIRHHEPDIRRLIFNITTFSRIDDERCEAPSQSHWEVFCLYQSVHTLHAVLAQLVSNIISPVSAEPGASRIAEDRLSIYLRGRREDDVIL